MALPSESLPTVASLLLNAKEPLYIPGYSGRNHHAVVNLVALAITTYMRGAAISTLHRYGVIETGSFEAV